MRGLADLQIKFVRRADDKGTQPVPERSKSVRMIGQRETLGPGTKRAGSDRAFATDLKPKNYETDKLRNCIFSASTRLQLALQLTQKIE